MKSPATLDLDRFPDSPYACELRRGFPDLRFAPELERDYQAFHLVRVRTRVRFFLLALLVQACMAGMHLLWLDRVPLRQVLHGWTGLAIPMCAVLVGLSFSPWYERMYRPAARFVLPLLGMAAAADIAHRMVLGHPDPLYFLTSYSIALFFLGGQLFHEALIANALLIVTHGATLAWQHDPWSTVAYYTGVLAVTATIGAFVYRGMELQLRTSFLERGLMGEMAARDGLTGLKNRGAFDAHLPRIWGQGQRERRQLAVLMIDVDHFKTYNDHYGHQAGDAALRRVAQVVQSFARRPLDIAARYGGEEFVLALFDVTGEHARDIAEQLRLSVQALSISHEASATAPVVTASIGVAIVGPRQGRSQEGAVQLADEALYSAKRGGRNCVRFAEIDTSFSTGAFRRRTIPPFRSARS
jgi:diguanylate cyclase (GGDEF)-like protein